MAEAPSAPVTPTGTQSTQVILAECRHAITIMTAMPKAPPIQAPRVNATTVTNALIPKPAQYVSRIHSFSSASARPSATGSENMR